MCIRDRCLTKLETARHSIFAVFPQTCRDALLVRDELSAINAALSVGKIMGVQGAFCVDPTGRVVAHSDPARAPGHPGRGPATRAPPAPMAKRMPREAAMGHPCGLNFSARSYLKLYPQFTWLRPLLKDLPSRPWPLFEAPP